MLNIPKQFATFLFLLLSVSGLHAEDSKMLESVESSARAWLNLTDHKKYAESWKNASALFQANAPESEWIKNVTTIRSPLGAMKSRYLATAHSATSVPNAPDGAYVIVQFYTTFEHKALTLETVTATKEQDNIWRVSDYLIK